MHKKELIKGEIKMSFNDFEHSTFEWNEINGKTLKIIVSEDKSNDDETVRLIFGKDKKGKLWLLHWEGIEL